MSELNDKVIGQLEYLLSICNDGIEGYKKAADNAKGPEFTTLFTDYVIQRNGYASELKEKIRSLGGDADNKDGGSLGMLHRLWIDIKSKLASNEEHAALEACITGEKAAISAYDDVIKEDALAADLKELLEDQRAGIQKALTRSEQLVRVYTTN